MTCPGCGKPMTPCWGEHAWMCNDCGEKITYHDWIGMITTKEPEDETAQ